MVSEDSGVDALAHLEERVHRAVELVAKLRAERDAAVAELARVKKAGGVSEAEAEKLRAERTQVRSRIEKLLGQLDLLSES
jgi:FtsZ-binding cell division protein ZapB